MGTKWMQEAVEKPGALRAYVRRKYGKKGFTRKGTIKKSTLRKIKKDPHATGRTKKRASLALTFRRYGKKKKR